VRNPKNEYKLLTENLRELLKMVIFRFDPSLWKMTVFDENSSARKKSSIFFFLQSQLFNF